MIVLSNASLLSSQFSKISRSVDQFSRRALFDNSAVIHYDCYIIKSRKVDGLVILKTLTDMIIINDSLYAMSHAN